MTQEMPRRRPRWPLMQSRLDDLAARVTARAVWDDLVLPRAQRELLRQVLLGVTGSGKTFTIANVIQRAQRPAMVMALTVETRRLAMTRPTASAARGSSLSTAGSSSNWLRNQVR